jgi:hypothetical protein
MNNKLGLFISVCIIGGLIGTYIYTKSKPSKPEVILPHYGIDSVVTKIVDGKSVLDTIYHVVPDFKFINQEEKKWPLKTWIIVFLLLISFLLLVQVFVKIWLFRKCVSIKLLQIISMLK